MLKGIKQRVWISITVCKLDLVKGRYVYTNQREFGLDAVILRAESSSSNCLQRNLKWVHIW